MHNNKAVITYNDLYDMRVLKLGVQSNLVHSPLLHSSLQHTLLENYLHSDGGLPAT